MTEKKRRNRRESPEWEAEIRMRRNGRLVELQGALGSTPAAALWFVYSEMQRWADDHPESHNSAMNGDSR